MLRFSKKSAIVILLTGGIAVAAWAQDKKEKREERRPTNLTVLPKNISHDSLIYLMKEYSVSLGVNCGFCHDKSATDERLYFAGDNNGHKKVARYMMQMTAGINSKYFAEENHESKSLMVSCYTCHHGQKEPEAFVMPKEEERH